MPGAVSYRVRELWKGIINASLHENDITQSLMRAVRKDPESSKRVKEELFYILTTSDSESEDENECEMAATGSHETRAARKPK